MAERCFAGYIPARSAVGAAGPERDVSSFVRTLCPWDLGISEV